MKLVQRLASLYEWKVMHSYDPGLIDVTLQNEVLTTATNLAFKAQEYINVIEHAMAKKDLQAKLEKASKEKDAATAKYLLVQSAENNAAQSKAAKDFKDCKAKADKGPVQLFARQKITIGAMAKRIGEVEGKLPKSEESKLVNNIKENTFI